MEGFGQPANSQAYPLADLAPTGAQLSLGHAPASHQFSTNTIPLLPSGPPSEVGSYSTNSHPRALNHSGAAGSMNASSSGSHRQSSLFDNASVSGYSQVNSSLNIGPPPSQIWVVPVTTSNPVLSTWLQKHPHMISLADLTRETQFNRYNAEWTNWEKQFIITFWVGPETEPHLVFTAMGSQKSPGPQDRFSPEWEMV